MPTSRNGVGYNGVGKGGTTMPTAIHDWTRVDAGVWHDFHQAWTAEIRRQLNGGLLPPPYYAMIERVTSDPLDRRRVPDVLTLSATDDRPEAPSGQNGAVGVQAAPRTRFHSRVSVDVPEPNRVTVRHARGHRVVAAIELVSPGNKASVDALDSFIDKAVAFLHADVHLLIVDLFPPTPRDPQGIHGAIWRRLTAEPFALPADEPLTLAAYRSGLAIEAFVEPTAVGAQPPPMAVFLRPGHIMAPLAETYAAAFAGVPRFWQDELS